MDGITSIGVGFYGAVNKSKRKETTFLSLTKVKFHDMPNWEEWLGVGDSGFYFPSLSELEIRSCPKLKSLPAQELRLVSSAKIYQTDLISSVFNDASNKDDAVSSLRQLTIENCNSLQSLYVRDLTSLKDLKVLHCRELVEITADAAPTTTKIDDSIVSSQQPDESTSPHTDKQQRPLGPNGVWDLKIEDCPKLMSLNLPTSALGKLRKLVIYCSGDPYDSTTDICGSSCPIAENGKPLPATSDKQVVAAGNRRLLFEIVGRLHAQLSSLDKLEISNCSQLIAFTAEEEQGFSSLTSLRSLCLGECRRLVSLPARLHTLPCLEKLICYKCPGIRALPGLPDSLQRLTIQSCSDELKQRCEENGKDWEKIALIKYRRID